MALDPEEKRKALRSLGRFSAVGWEFSIAVIGSVLLGYWADGKFGTSPVLTLVGLGVGGLAGTWILYKVTKAMNKELGGNDGDQGKR